MKRCSFFPAAYLLLLLFTSQSFAQTPDPSLFKAMQWRMIGPHRGGRTVGAAGVPQQPNVFYIGVNNGGVWKTNDYGRTWAPLFDDQATGSIGDIAVTPSNPNVIYVGTGEGLQRPDLSVGNGMYRSTDGGKTWQHLGLSDGQQIGGIAIDPRNENRVFVAVLGHPYGPNTERGVYRTDDGGKSWKKLLYKDENTGAIQVTVDPHNPSVVYADLWAGRQGPWENGAWQGPESGLYKSTDGGDTWKKLTNGLPTYAQGLGRIGFCVSPADPNRLYATVDAAEMGGLYRSDDAGESWTRMSADGRLWGRGSDFAEVKADPRNPDIVYDANVVTWKSTDGGATWNAFRGAPGGDDYHRIWINPDHPEILMIAGDQGAIITVNGGQTFSSWYNQPTAQFYHVSTDNAFPYNVYGGQQESGSVGIASRGNDGQITFREWHPVAAEEYGYVAPDPLHPDIIYGGKITRYNKRTGQVQNIAPEAVRSGRYRFLRTAPVLFSPIDPKTLYFAGNVLFKTANGGHSWQVISPDLSRESWDVPESVGIYRTDEMKTMPRRGVIYTVAPSPKDIHTIWAGTDDGLIHVTRDGGRSWKNVTPAAITSWSKISLMEAGHYDINTCYAAVNRIRFDDMHPHIYRTHDGGRSWQEIVNGLPDDPINVIREDPVRKGLLFAGSEKAVYVSFDDGDHWQSLRLNMPATSVRDLVIKDQDIVAGTHGRSFWILDDISALRQIAAPAVQGDMLFRPGISYRVRWDMNPDTPLPQEEPAGQNPPDGAIIDYYLSEAADKAELDILDSTGRRIRHFSSSDSPYVIPDVNIPLYWVRPQQILSATQGAHRFVWDLHYTPLALPPSYPIAAVYGNTAPDPTSPWVMPGKYMARLTVHGKTMSQPFTVRLDPRVRTPLRELQLQHDLSLACYTLQQQVLASVDTINSVRKQISERKNTGALATALARLDEHLAETIGKPEAKLLGLGVISGNIAGVFNTLHDADDPPTEQAQMAVKELRLNSARLFRKWNDIRDHELADVNRQLRAAGEPVIELTKMVRIAERKPQESNDEE